jgi:hypothetical protein
VVAVGPRIPVPARVQAEVEVVGGTPLAEEEGPEGRAMKHSVD